MVRQVFSSGVIVFFQKNDERFYLVLHYQHGHWGFAKGKQEKGEGKKQTAMRELKEETGLDVRIIPGFESFFSYDYQEVDGQPAHKTVTFFLGQADTMDVTLSDEHIDYAWLPFEQAMHRLTYINAQDALDKAHQFLD